MSKSVGIIAEYNPFHTGHAYQLNYLKKMGYDTIVVAQSGSCVQRGEIGVVSKFARSHMAVDSGASLVVEIPMPYSALSAEGFASAGVFILKNLGVEALCFGSESADIQSLTDIAQYLLTEEYSSKISILMLQKRPFAEARQQVLMEKFDVEAGFLSSSNDILAIEYIKACIKQNWQPRLIAIKRTGVGYNAILPQNGFFSASGIRNLVKSYRFEDIYSFIPQEAKNTLQKQLNTGSYFIEDEAYEKALIFSLRQKDYSYFLNVPDCNKELAHSFEKALSICSNIEQLLNALPTKQYTKSRLKRIMLYSFLSIERFYPEYPPFIRILAMDKNGEPFIKHSSSVSCVPISHSYKILEEINKNCSQIIKMETTATDAFFTFAKIPCEARKDYTTKLYKRF